MEINIHTCYYSIMNQHDLHVHVITKRFQRFYSFISLYRNIDCVKCMLYILHNCVNYHHYPIDKEIHTYM